MNGFNYLFTICLLLFNCEIFAAGPLTHAYLSELFFDHFPKYTEEEKNQFRAGTLFPDIRYLGGILREETHFDSMTLNEILSEPSPFIAGVKFHSYVDSTREDYVSRSQIYEHVREIQMPHMASFLKIVEDEILFPKNSWDAWIEALQKIYPEELQWNIKKKSIRKWHLWMNASFAQSPSASIAFFVSAGEPFLNIPHDELILWNLSLIPLANSEGLLQYTESLIEHFETEMSNVSQVYSIT